MATDNNEQELFIRSKTSNSFTLKNLDNNSHGNATQIAQANHDARHLKSSLLKNPDISGWKLATVSTYTRLNDLIYDTEPIEVSAALDGIQKGSLKTQAGLVIGLLYMHNNPGQAWENMKQAFAESADNPSKALDEFAFGSMEERTRLANIMEIDDPKQRVAAHHQYFTEFFANRSIALATTIAGGNTLAQVKNAGMKALDKAIENTISTGGPGANGGLVYAFETEGLNAASVANEIAKTEKNIQVLPLSTGAMIMSSDPNNHSTSRPIPFSEEIKYGPAKITGTEARLAKEQYDLLSRLELTLKHLNKDFEVPPLANADHLFRMPSISPLTEEAKVQAQMANMLLPSISEARNEAMVNLLKTQSIPNESALLNLLLKEDGNLFKIENMPVSAQAEARVLNNLLTNLQTRADIPPEMLGKAESSTRLVISLHQVIPATELNLLNMPIFPAAASPGP